MKSRTLGLPMAHDSTVLRLLGVETRAARLEGTFAADPGLGIT
jgi:hypothetical protein